MDVLISSAARALAAGDPLTALNWIALREDAAALALRGIALAQMGDLARSRTLVRQAAHGFGNGNPVARARCIVAEADIAFAARDLAWPVKALDAARSVLEQHGDQANASHAHYLAIRRLLLLGQLEQAEQLLPAQPPASPTARTVHELIVAGIALRRLQAGAARAALMRARRAAEVAGIAALRAEVDNAFVVLDSPAARLLAPGEDSAGQLLRPEQVEALLAAPALVIDGCRYLACSAQVQVSLATRPVLFALLQALARAWPADAAREELVALAFRARQADESYRARLRVEIGRLRTLLQPLADIKASARGFLLVPRQQRAVRVLVHPVDARHAALLALLADGAAWSSSALALALESSQRTVQRALETLAATARVQSFGHGRARRWLMPPIPGFPDAATITTALLLPPSPATD